MASLVVFQKYTIKEYNPSLHILHVAILDFTYMFRLLQSNHHQAVYQKH